MTYKRYLIERDLRGIAKICWIGEDNGFYLILDQTLFHPQGGGQQSDVGFIDNSKVIRVVNIDDEVRHYFEKIEGVNFDIGQEVELKIDSKVRNENSKLHSGGHLTAAVVEDVYPMLKAIGGHHWKGEARVEFVGDEFPEMEELNQILPQAISRAINNDLAVKVLYDENNDRSVQIGEFSAVGCGGTHIQSLRELSKFEITKIRIKSGKLRISYQV
ncbi:MAG: alanine--tRNA ligase-related protein [Pyrinomonadaceae bacterium]|jgi:Ser-tRNA(Ala) deacylase AlaX|nr:alanine--tRNA ligase-related protein [Pyrinomonadaceae bacterium]